MYLILGCATASIARYTMQTGAKGCEDMAIKQISTGDSRVTMDRGDLHLRVLGGDLFGLLSQIIPRSRRYESQSHIEQESKTFARGMFCEQ